jgi:hypothetical protein
MKHEFQVRSDCRESPVSAAVRLVKKSEQTGSVRDNNKGIVDRKMSVRMP